MAKIKGRVTSIRIYSRKTTYEIVDTNRETYKWSQPTAILNDGHGTLSAKMKFQPGEKVTFKKKGYFDITEPELCS